MSEAVHSQSLQPIFIDVYPEDLNGAPAWAAAAADPRIAGALLWVTEGTTLCELPWLRKNWRAIHSVDRTIGTDWFCGAYHYLIAAEDGDAQAAYFLEHLEAAGGLGAQDLWPIVDVESKDNRGATASQFVDTTSAFAAGILSRTGRPTMLYGGETIRELGITSRMGCSWLWTAHYTPTLPESKILSMGWTEATLWGWQYQGTGPSNQGELSGYPISVANFAGVAEVDLTVMVMPDGLAGLRQQLSALGHSRP